jgi:xanthine dehydrogenase accessory factor
MWLGLCANAPGLSTPAILRGMESVCLRGGDLDAALAWLRAEPGVLVWVERTEGSAPREPGAWMLVGAQRMLGTIGGGQLEWHAIQQARAGLRQPGWAGQALRCALGPSLGQCCGGVVHLRLQRVTAADAAALRAAWVDERVPVALFGGGHVGQAIERALRPLPFALTWIDSRDGMFPTDLPPTVVAEHSDPVERAVADLVPGSRVLVMSFSHAEDLAVVDACLQRLRQQDDLPFVGLIGSRTKWAAFQHRLLARGHDASALARVTCPVGIPGIQGKEPAVIAAAVAAQLLMTR